MARLDIERKRKTLWPWLAGVVALLLILMGITTLMQEDAETEPEVVVPTVEDTYPPAAVPAPPNEEPVGAATDAARGVEEIAPLGEEDVGQTVRLAGEVVATGNDVFWLLAGADLLPVESDRRVRKGDTVSLEGTLRPADPNRTDRMSDILERHPASAGWNVVRVIKLVEESAAESDRASLPRPEA